MGGRATTQAKLNNTLKFIAGLLNDNGIKNWFIAYGTLLGIVRENACIVGDDDVDIVCDGEDYDKIKKIMTDNSLSIEYGRKIKDSRSILKTIATREYGTVDFYMATISEAGDFHDKWENVIWSDCFVDGDLIEHAWNDVMLYLPNNHTTKLTGRYGNWKIPEKTKGLSPKALIL